MTVVVSEGGNSQIATVYTYTRRWRTGLSPYLDRLLPLGKGYEGFDCKGGLSRKCQYEQTVDLAIYESLERSDAKEGRSK